ncbi:hypothetical protein K9M74_00380 [Candidatus Woesearchaeota archaeon]|nr:hypothetical protein [Candidatus Woesearchaeota archaeon]
MPQKKRKQKMYPVRKRIFFEGIISGLFVGMSAVSGLTIDPSDLTVSILNQVCSRKGGEFNCSKLVAGASLLFLLLSIFTLGLEIHKLKKPVIFAKWRIMPWVEGLIIYIVGILIAFTTIIIIF